MRHPLTSSWKYHIIYVVFWLLLLTNHYFFDYRIFEASGWLSFVDSLWSCFTFYLIGLALWFMVRYSAVESQDVLTIIFNQLAILAVTVIIWLAVVYGGVLLSQVPEYNQFFYRSLLWRVLMAILYYVLIITIYYLIRYSMIYQEKLQKENDIKQAAKEAELKMLRAQINPHFLFNSLNSASALTLDSPAKARDMLNQLSDFLRLSLKEDPQRFITLEREIERIWNYLEVEKVRFGEKMKVKLVVDKECLGTPLPPMILQPLMENAIKHGVSDRIEPTTIEMIASEDGDDLTIKITNDFDADGKPKKNSGLGLENIRQRLKTIYHRVDLIQISAENNRFEVILTIPKNGRQD